MIGCLWTRVRKQPIIALYFEYETVLKFYNLGARSHTVLELFYDLLYILLVHSSIAIILMGKRELVALLDLSSWCLVMVKRLFLVVPVGLSVVCDCGIS